MTGYAHGELRYSVPLWSRTRERLAIGPCEALLRAMLILITLLVLLFSLWALLALWFQAPWPPAGRYVFMALWMIGSLGVLWLLWSGRAVTGLCGFVLGLILLRLWWNALKPSHQRDWADDLAHITTGEVQGSRVVLHHVRNFDWHGEQDYRAAWETRRYDLNQLQSVDVITSYWGIPAIAHILVSFGFSDGRFISFTVEVRREKTEVFSELGGFFKQFELAIIASDERDAVHVRTNIRGEDAYLYRVELSDAAMRSLFLAYVNEANRLAEEPRFYQTVTANCTTLVFRMMQSIVAGLPLDYRLLLSGYLPSYIEKQGGLQPGYSLAQMREAGRITLRAREAGRAEDFSAVIRQGVPGWRQ
ncbi:Lnb N-terminal periplasmic domain-containing protein [Halopseudomonas sp.]|uniref:Lnb N-terminal periplasmic domain-containing protein n=1 Tax=Halopseudomonas sp. TaxID=2901191 RepID=UPI0030030790